MNRVKDLDGRVALVSGGGRGIGLAIATELAGRGASVVIADNGAAIDGSTADPGIARAAVAKIGGQARAFTESVASPSAAAAAVALARSAFGGIDIVVNNAAILRDAFIFKGDAGDWEAVLRNNLSAAYYLLAAATPLMREQAKSKRGGDESWGRIVNITSSAGVHGNLGQSAYASAKAGLIGLTRVVAMEMARSGVTCNALMPFAATRVTESIKPANDAQASYKARALKLAPEHVAKVVAWLCSAQAQDISGQLIGVRGREVFLFAQARPVARLVRNDDDGAFAASAAKEFRPHTTDLRTDLEIYDNEPVV